MKGRNFGLAVIFCTGHSFRHGLLGLHCEFIKSHIILPSDPLAPPPLETIVVPSFDYKSKRTYVVNDDKAVSFGNMPVSM